MIGASGTGKTLALMNAILTPDVRMQWDRILVFARFINEPLYELIQTRVDEYQDKYGRIWKKEDAKHIRRLGWEPKKPI